MSDWDLWHPLLFQAVLIRGHGVTALVNTGPVLGPMNRHWVAMLGDRAPLSREPGQFIVDALAAHGVTLSTSLPDEVLVHRSGSLRASLRRKPPTPASVAPLTSSCRSTTRRTWNDSPTGL